METIRRATAIRIFSLLFGVLVLVAFIYYVGVGSVERILLSVSPILILFMVLLQLLSFVFYTSAWYLLIQAAGYKMRFLICQEITLASIFAVYTMPSGVFLEAARCFFATKETGMKLGESAATVILHRILYVVGFLACTAFATIALLVSGMMNSATLVELGAVPVITVAGLIILLLLSFDPKKIEPLLDYLLKIARPIIRLIQKEAVVDGKADQFLGEYKSGFSKMISSRREMTISLASSIGDWASSVTILWIVLTSMGANTSLWVVMITMAIGKMIQMTPIAIPGMIGVYEAAITTVLSLFHVPIPIAASAALLSRIVTVWLELPITGAAAYHLGFRLLSHGSENVSLPLAS